MSGTKASNGIKNLIWAYVMTEKGDVTNNVLMKIGEFHVIKDNNGHADNTTWPSAIRTFEPVFGFSTDSANKNQNINPPAQLGD